jgi:dCTP deaminase
MILAYDDLIEAWQNGTLQFSPNVSLDQIGESSIDLRLGWVFTRLKRQAGVVIQPARGFNPTDLVEHQDLSETMVLGKAPPFRIEPQGFFLAFTLEEVTVPKHLAASVQGKSSLARAGLAIHITAPTIHPGFSGRIVLEFYNHGPWELELMPGEDRVCQIIFSEVKTPVPEKVTDTIATYIKQETPFPPRRD